MTLEEIAALAPEKIVIRRPCTPDEAGISSRLSATMPENAAAGRLSRHQAIARVWRDYRAGGPVMHGKTSLIEHNGEGVFQGLNNPRR